MAASPPLEPARLSSMDPEPELDHAVVADADSPPRPVKRQKVLSACDVCHAKKSKCDGGRPFCAPCIQRSERYGTEVSCAYSRDAPGATAVRPRVNTQHLIDRIHSLERVIASSQHDGAGSASPAPDSGREPPTQARKRNRLPSSPFPEVPATGSSNAWISVNNPPPRVADVGRSPVRAGASTGPSGGRGTPPATGAHPQLLGAAPSAAHFMRQIIETNANTSRRQSHAAQPHAKALPPRANALGTSYGKALLAEDFSLPQRDLADTLLEVYWTRSHTLGPFIDRDRFMRAYQDLWLPSRPSQESAHTRDLGLGTPGLSDSRTAVFHCALNAVLALACQLSQTAISCQDRDALSQTFFLRSQGLLNVDVTDDGTVALVQTLLVIAQFLQSTSSPSRCWTSVGLSCRIAQGLGLHVEDHSDQRDHSENEIRRRVWYGCIIMDTMASMALGRPMTTHGPVTIPFPAATVDDGVADLNQPISQLTFYNEAIKLSLALGKILSTTHKPRSVPGPVSAHEDGLTCRQAPTMDWGSVLSLDEEISDLEDAVPAVLRWETGNRSRSSLPEPLQPIVEVQSNVLHARFLHTRILLHRPTFLRFCKKAWSHGNSANGQTVGRVRREHSLRSHLDSQSATACLSAAIDLVDVLFNATTHEVAGPWWDTTFYLCTAGMVILLAEASLQSHEYLNFDIDEIHSAWALCCEALRHLVEKEHPVAPVLKGLNNIHKKLATVDQSSAPRPGNSPEAATSATPAPGPQSESTQENDLSSEHDETKEPPTDEPEEMLTLPLQPVMDFMMRENFMPFPLLDSRLFPLS